MELGSASKKHLRHLLQEIVKVFDRMRVVCRRYCSNQIKRESKSAKIGCQVENSHVCQSQALKIPVVFNR